MKFCEKCGLELQEEVAFCPNCGNKVTVLTESNNNPKIIQSKKKLTVIICAVVLLVAIVVSIFAMGGDDYEEVAQNYISAVIRSDFDVAKKYAPFDVEDAFGNMEDDILDLWDYDSYDNEYVVTTEVIRSYEINQDKIERVVDEIEEELNFDYGFEIDDYMDITKIKKAYQVKVRVSVYEPSDDEEWPAETLTCTVVKYKGKWRVLTGFISDRDILRDVW